MLEGKCIAVLVDEPVVRDNNIITARKPFDLPRFNEAIYRSFNLTE